MNKFKHSGAFGDLIYSLPIVKHFNGGEFYLHLNQIDWIGQHYYGSPPNPFHQGRMTQQDFEYMKSFMLAQSYITKFDIMRQDTEITHNLDKFRLPFVGHPGNYIDIYSSVFGLNESAALTARSTAWLTVPEVRQIKNRPVVINRSLRWIPGSPGKQWNIWQQEGMEDQAIFVGLPEEHAAFQKATKWTIPHISTNSMLEVAELIAGSEKYIGNQSQGLALAIGLGVKEINCEARVDMPLERNECYFPDMINIKYFNI